MSGTSADGIDAVVAEISGSGRGLRARVVAHAHEPFKPALRRRKVPAASDSRGILVRFRAMQNDATVGSGNVNQRTAGTQAKVQPARSQIAV